MSNNFQVLIVEDDKSWTNIYAHHLGQDPELQCVWTTSYESAKLELRPDSNFDIAIIDLSLSEGDEAKTYQGTQLIQELSASFPPPIVIVSSGFIHVTEENPEFPEDFVFYKFSKADPIDELISAVQRAKRQKRAQRLMESASKFTSATSPITDELKNILRQFVNLTHAFVCHLLLPTEDDKSLEIVVDTGNDEGRQVPIDDSVTGAAYLLGKAINLGDTSLAPHYKQISDNKTMKSELAVPLLEDNRAVGILNIESEQLNAFTPEHEEAMSTFARFVVATLQSDHLKLDLQDLLVTTANHLLESVVNLDKILETILQRGCKLIEANRGFVAIREGNALVTRATTDPEVWPKGSTLSVTDSICGKAIERGYALNIKDVTQEPYKHLYKAALGNLRSELVVPLRLERNVIGVLNFESPEVSAFTSEDQRFLVALANQASIAIRITDELEKRRLAERSETVADLAAGLSHNVRSPADGIQFDLTQIREKFSHLLEDYHNLKLKEYLNRIERAASKIQNVPQQIAERVEQYRPPVPIDCKTLILPRLAVMKEKKQLRNDKVQILIDESVYNSAKFLAYEEHTHLLVDNLILNAIQVMKDNGIIKISQQLQDNRSIQICFEDNGPGVPLQLREAIFARDFTTRQGIEFGGVGLWWVRMHLARLNATIEVGESNFGGAKFLIHFPRFIGK